MSNIITAAMLRGRNACESQVKIFEAEWPNGLTLDESCVDRVVALSFDVDWFAGRFLTDQAWAEYLRVKDQALAEYERVVDQAWAEYERVVDQAWAEYLRVKAPALAEYLRVTAPALAEYLRVKASAVIRLYIKGGAK